MALEKIFCRSSAEGDRGRENSAMGGGAKFEIKLSTQPFFRRAGGNGTNPEPLFVGYSDYFRQKWQKT